MRTLPPSPANDKPRTFQGYQRRTPEQWRAARNGALDRRTLDWLTRVLNAADRSVILSDWESSFCLDFDERFKRYGRSIRISPKQLDVLRRIEAKLAGRRA
jgi:hypothetical protein